MVKSQLSLLLRDLGYTIKCIESFAELNNSLAATPSSTAVLLDLKLSPTSEDFLTVRTHAPGIQLIGIEHFSADNTTARPTQAAGLDQCILLPRHSERAKSRLKKALQHIRPAKQSNRTVASTTIKFKRPASRFSIKTTTVTRPTPQPTPTTSRYIASHSIAALTFIEQLCNNTAGQVITILTGEDGCEFELAARELNYQDNQDRIPLQFITDESFDAVELEKIERTASKNNQQINCYIGRTDDLCKESVDNLERLIEYLENIRSPHLHLILTHELGSETLFKQGTAEALQNILKKRRALHIPPMRERAEDIAPICHSLIGSLRAAHPFLVVYSITSETVQYLIESRNKLSHNKLVRMLRNSIALSRHNALCVEDMKNYGESDTTTQHLLESMADESFFPAPDAANL